MAGLKYFDASTIMPRKKSGRRHRVSSDTEEDDVMEDGTAYAQKDEEVKVKTEVVKKGKGKAPERRRRAEEDGSDEQDEDEEMEDESDDNNARIDVSDFKDQPLGRGELQKLHGLAADWSELDYKIQQSWGGIRQVALAIAETADGEEGEKVCCSSCS